MILVTGATGHVGSELIRLLAAAGEPVRDDPAAGAGPHNGVANDRGDSHIWATGC